MTPISAAVGDWMQRHGRWIRLLQWAVVLFYGVLVIVPALLPLPDEPDQPRQHWRCPDCAMAAPRSGREKQPRRPRARPRAKSEENANRPEEDASKTIFGRRRRRKKMHVHSG